MYVKTDYTGCEYVTAGKVYEVFAFDNVRFSGNIRDDYGIDIFVNFAYSQHLNFDGTWIICDKEGNEL